jgi:hypothetical protein
LRPPVPDLADLDTLTATAAGPALLYTPTQAAAMLATTETWLRRKAGQHLIPATRRRSPTRVM